jgi:HEPN domain-containing protein
MKKQVEAWIGFAGKDLLTVSEIIENPDLTNVVTFHCQQAIEKYFKAFKLEHDKPLLKIHNLLALYGMMKETINLELNEDLLSMINDIYLESRYPGEIGLLDDGSMPTSEQANQFFNFAKEVEVKIKNELNIPPVRLVALHPNLF